MVVTFCGHADVYDLDDIRKWLDQVVTSLIMEGEVQFLLGGYGKFDELATSVLGEQKKTHASIEMVLILPYLHTNMDVSCYDYTLYPPLESVPPRFAIRKRNQWMVAASDVVVAYVMHSWGGAAKTLAYAKQKQRRIIQYSKSPPQKRSRQAEESAMEANMLSSTSGKLQ